MTWADVITVLAVATTSVIVAGLWWWAEYRRPDPVDEHAATAVTDRPAEDCCPCDDGLSLLDAEMNRYLKEHQ